MAEKKAKAEESVAEKETAAKAEEAAAEQAEEKSELEKLQEEIRAQNDKYLRLAAEYDNFRKRTAKEKEMLYGDATAASVAAFLTVYDNLVICRISDILYKSNVLCKIN